MPLPHLSQRFGAWLAGFSVLGVLLSPAAARERSCPAPSRIEYEQQGSIRRSELGFTQGLIFYQGYLYESTGRYGESALQRIHPRTGAVERLRSLPDSQFGEGLDHWDGRFVQLTWKEHIAILHDSDLSEQPSTLPFPWEGWGLTHDWRNWIASDGSSTLRFLDRETLRERRSLPVRRENREQPLLNELENIGKTLLANIYGSDEIVAIHPGTGCVIGTLDLSPLYRSFSEEERKRLEADPEAVANGIAHDPVSGTLYVTGKNWPLIFRLRAAIE